MICSLNLVDSLLYTDIKGMNSPAIICIVILSNWCVRHGDDVIPLELHLMKPSENSQSTTPILLMPR